MLNFAEQTGSGAVIVVWSFLKGIWVLQYMKLELRSLSLCVHLTSSLLAARCCHRRGMEEGSHVVV